MSTPEEICVRVLQRCLVQNPDCVELRVRLALCQVALGDPGAAEATLRSAVELDPGHLPTRLHLGWLLDLLGRRGEAAGEYRAVLAQDPAHPEARRRVVQLAHEPPGLDERGDGPNWWAQQAALRFGAVPERPPHTP